MIICKLHRLLPAAWLLIAAACSGTTDEPRRAEATQTLGVSTTYTRTEAGSAPETPGNATGKTPTEQELIHHWWAVAVDSDGKVKDIINDKPLTTPGDRDQALLKLSDGEYSILAFANISTDELKEAAGIEFDATGTKTLDVETLKKSVWKQELNLWGDKPIPMSGYGKVTVKGGAISPSTIELVRMVGKIELHFTNSTSKDVTVKSVTLLPHAIGSGDDASGLPSQVSLFPDYGNLGKSPASQLVSDTRHGRLTYHCPSDMTLAKDESSSASFYVREWAVGNTHPTGHYHLDIEIVRDGAAGSEALHAMLNKTEWINRNDWLYILVRITDWDVTLDVSFYPPIGGYPSVEIDHKNEESYFIFGTQGRFVVTPRVRDVESGDYLAPDKVNVNIVSAEETPDTPGESIFTASGTPKADAITGEIIGELSDKTGNAVVTVEITVADDAVSRKYSRKFYIIRSSK